MTALRKAADPMRGYKPMQWSPESQLSKDEQTQVEIQRQSLWRHGIRRQPMLDRMAFEFGYVACLLRAASTARPGENAGGDEK